MFPSPRDLLPAFHCPLCPPAVLLAAPTTLRCGHTFCASHVHSRACPLPDCSFPPPPTASRVSFSAPLTLPTALPHPPLDVRVNNIMQLIQTAIDAARLSVSPPDSDDDSDPEDSHRHFSDPPDFHKALVTELSCEICFMLLYEPVTTPCQHTFCSQCLQRSLDHSMVCPLCRQAFPGFAYFHEHPFNKIILSLLLTALPDDYTSRGVAIESEEHDARLDTPILVCQLAFPGMRTLLHFFEPRYRLMLRRCLEKPSPTFGIIMPPRAAPVPGHLTAGSEFGTMLEIRNVQMFADGRSVVETFGTHRFRLLEEGSLDGYIVGRVERIDDYDDDLAEWIAQEDGRRPSSSVDTHAPSPPSLLSRIALRVSPPPSPVSPLGSQDSITFHTSPQFLSTSALMAICHAFLNQLRAGTAPWVVQRLDYTYGPQPPDTDPGTFSFWMGMVLPIDEHEKAKLLPVKSARLRLRMVVGWIEHLNSNWWFTSGCIVL